MFPVRRLSQDHLPKSVGQVPGPAQSATATPAPPHRRHAALALAAAEPYSAARAAEAGQRLAAAAGVLRQAQQLHLTPLGVMYSHRDPCARDSELRFRWVFRTRPGGFGTHGVPKTSWLRLLY